MRLLDAFLFALSNLTRMKLRSSLTIAGVVIGIAALISMMSFGAGMQKNISQQYDKLGLLHTMVVYPVEDDLDSDSSRTSVLNDSAITELKTITGVKLAYPFESFKVSIQIGDTIIESTAQSLQMDATSTKAYSNLAAGKLFQDETDKSVILSWELFKSFGIHDPDSIIGEPAIVSVKSANPDSVFKKVLTDIRENAALKFRETNPDSLFNRGYLDKIFNRELKFLMTSFMDGLMNSQYEISDTLAIVGIMEDRSVGYRLRIKPVLMPIQTARNFLKNQLPTDPMELFAAFRNGTLFATNNSGDAKIYPQATLEFDPGVPYSDIKAEVEKRGFDTFSYAEEFEEMLKFFLFFDMGLAVLGFIALTVAGLGITNTMIMSIVERHREIGIFKSLGADDSIIRFIFLVESATIGLLGGIIGIIFGWLITRIASFTAKIIMQRQDIPLIELFHLPLWLIAIALVFGIVISIIAGILPAIRAAKVDPVQALRYN